MPSVAEIIGALAAVFAYTALLLGVVKWLASRFVREIDNGMAELKAGQVATKAELKAFVSGEIARLANEQAEFERESMQDRANLRKELADLRVEIPREYLRRGELDHRLGSIEEGLNWIRNYLVERKP